MNARRNVFGLTLLLALATMSLGVPGVSGIPRISGVSGISGDSAISGGDAPPPAAGPQGAPIVQEYRYRLSGAIRPLLFWIGDGDVGAARIRWHSDEKSRRGYELLIGSDPSRAPREINRWGWVWEEQREDGATQMGVMRKIDEEALDEAKSEVDLNGDHVFKAIRSEIVDGQARAENTVWLVENDYTYYDLDALLRLMQGPPQDPPSVNEGPVTPDTHPGLLFAVADLVDRAVTGATLFYRRLLEDVTTHYSFDAVVCDMTLKETKWEDSKEYGGRRYERLVRLEFESYNPDADTKNRFTLVCGTEGELKGVPVYVKYQPKWWFRTEGVIDASQVFERSADHHAIAPESKAPEEAR